MINILLTITFTKVSFEVVATPRIRLAIDMCGVYISLIYNYIKAKLNQHIRTINSLAKQDVG